MCVWQEKCNNYLNDCSAHMWLPQNLLPPPSNFLFPCLLCPCFLYVFPFPNPLLLSLSPSLPAVLLLLSAESPFSLLATGHLSLSFSPPLSHSLVVISHRLLLRHFLNGCFNSFSLLPFLRHPLLFVCSRVPIKSCLCLIIAVIRRCANTCPAVCHQWSCTGLWHRGGCAVWGRCWGCQVDRQLFEMPFTGTAHTSDIERAPNCRGVTSHPIIG